MSAIVWYFEHSLALPFFGIGMKTDLYSPMATAEFSKFAGILCAALSQHHLSGFEIAHPYMTTGKTIKKDLNDPDSHDGVITHIEPDILECKVKWALGSHCKQS